MHISRRIMMNITKLGKVHIWVVSLLDNEAGEQTNSSFEFRFAGRWQWLCYECWYPSLHLIIYGSFLLNITSYICTPRVALDKEQPYVALFLPSIFDLKKVKLEE